MKKSKKVESENLSVIVGDSVNRSTVSVSGYCDISNNSHEYDEDNNPLSRLVVNKESDTNVPKSCDSNSALSNNISDNGAKQDIDEDGEDEDDDIGEYT